MDGRYKETKGAVDRSAGSQTLIGSYLKQAAAQNRRAGVMGGSTGRPDAGENARRKGLVSAQRAAQARETGEVFKANRQQVEDS